MEQVTDPIHEALEGLEEMKSYETSYSHINRLQRLINLFSALEQSAEDMAAKIAETEGRTPEDVYTEYFTRVRETVG